MEALHRAAYDADVDEVRTLLRAGVPVDPVDESGYTPLLWSCFKGAVGEQAPVIMALIEAGADPNAITERGDSSCLMLAVQSGELSAVKAIVDGGASLELPADGVTALMVAATFGHELIVDYLLQRGADARVNCGSFSAADYARHHGHDHLADLLEARINAS